MSSPCAAWEPFNHRELLGEGSRAGVPTRYGTGGTQSQSWALYSACPTLLWSSNNIPLAVVDLGTLLYPAAHLQPQCPGFHWYFPREERLRTALPRAVPTPATCSILFLLLFHWCFPSSERTCTPDAHSYSLYNDNGQRGHTNQSDPTWSQDLTTQLQTANPIYPAGKHMAG